MKIGISSRALEPVGDNGRRSKVVTGLRFSLRDRCRSIGYLFLAQLGLAVVSCDARMVGRQLELIETSRFRAPSGYKVSGVHMGDSTLVVWSSTTPVVLAISTYGAIARIGQSVLLEPISAAAVGDSKLEVVEVLDLGNSQVVARTTLRGRTAGVLSGLRAVVQSTDTEGNPSTQIAQLRVSR